MKAPHVNAMKLPAAPKPEVAKISTSFHPGKVRLTHHFSNGGTKEFSFHNPETATEHIRRALKREWREPQKNIGTEINNDLDLNK